MPPDNNHTTTDHAAWLQTYVTTVLRRRLRKYRGDGEFRVGDPPVRLNAFQKRVARILGMMAGGLDRAPVAWDKTLWDHKQGGMAVIWADNVMTWDFAHLTLLVFLCHEARIRCEITGLTVRHIRLAFDDRSHDVGMRARHPSLDEAVSWFKGYLPADHKLGDK